MYNFGHIILDIIYDLDLGQVPYNTEEIDVGIVCREVNEKNSSSTIKPPVFFEVIQDSCTLFFGLCQILVISRSTVCGQYPPVT